MNEKFLEYRSKYPNFYYHGFDVKNNKDNLTITFDFEIEGLSSFHPQTIIPLNNIQVDDNDILLKKIIFNLGMVEVISYVKLTCSPNIIVECGYLNEDQISFYKKLYYSGLGEFLYLNEIKVGEEELFNIITTKEEEKEFTINYQGVGNLIPIGGGKDSCVSLELLRDYQKDNLCFIINPKEVMMSCAQVAGYSQDKIIGVKRILDQKMIELNKQGFLNGHTPFSAMVAFTSFITAYLYKRRYIILSNENSANEATVLGTNINHQYSKTYEFENDFNIYTKKYFKIDLTYFSLLRPLSEIQIAMMFSKYPKYHEVFKSCNVGSKKVPWKWCCNCSKCLFVYIILSAFLDEKELVRIFGSNMYANKELLPVFLELLGYAETKPFDCVGTINEVRYAVSKSISKHDELPYLLQYYKDHYELVTNDECITGFNTVHYLPKDYEELLKRELNNICSQK
ncbi:MAG: hypothetical protein ACI31M_01860 [Bacilli bacterium]